MGKKNQLKDISQENQRQGNIIKQPQNKYEATIQQNQRSTSSENENYPLIKNIFSQKKNLTKILPLLNKIIKNKLPSTQNISRSEHFQKRQRFLGMIAKGPWRFEKKYQMNHCPKKTKEEDTHTDEEPSNMDMDVRKDQIDNKTETSYIENTTCDESMLLNQTECLIQEDITKAEKPSQDIVELNQNQKKKLRKKKAKENKKETQLIKDQEYTKQAIETHYTINAIKDIQSLNKQDRLLSIGLIEKCVDRCIHYIDNFEHVPTLNDSEDEIMRVRKDNPGKYAELDDMFDQYQRKMIVLYWLDPKNKKINMQQIIEDLQYINNISPKIFNKSYHGEVFYV